MKVYASYPDDTIIYLTFCLGLSKFSPLMRYVSATEINIEIGFKVFERITTVKFNYFHFIGFYIVKLFHRRVNFFLIFYIVTSYIMLLWNQSKFKTYQCVTSVNIVNYTYINSFYEKITI